MDTTSHFRPHRLRSLWHTLWQQVASRSTLIKWATAGAAAYLLLQALLFLLYDTSLAWFLPAKETHGNVILFTHEDTRFLIATLAAGALTLVGHFAFNEFWTFRDMSSPGRRPLVVRFGQFAATVLVAAGIVTVTVNVLKVRFDLYHFVALPVAVVPAAIWNWLWASRFIWRGDRDL